MLGFAFPVARNVRIMQKEVYLCKPRATWNEVGLYLGWSCSSLTSIEKHVKNQQVANFEVFCGTMKNGKHDKTWNTFLFCFGTFSLWFSCFCFLRRER